MEGGELPPAVVIPPGVMRYLDKVNSCCTCHLPASRAGQNGSWAQCGANMDPNKPMDTDEDDCSFCGCTSPWVLR